MLPQPQGPPFKNKAGECYRLDIHASGLCRYCELFLQAPALISRELECVRLLVDQNTHQFADLAAVSIEAFNIKSEKFYACIQALAELAISYDVEDIVYDYCNSLLADPNTRAHQRSQILLLYRHFLTVSRASTGAKLADCNFEAFKEHSYDSFLSVFAEFSGAQKTF